MPGRQCPSMLSLATGRPIIALPDCLGNRSSVNTYDEYGIPGSSNSGRFQYTGQAWIGEIGMYY